MEVNYVVILVLFWLVVANLLGFVFMGVDKQRAKNHAWRIPERHLLLTAFLGGGIGSLAGMLLFRHKTKHAKFTILVPLTILVNIACAVILFLWLS